MKQEKLSNLFDFLPKSKVKAGDGLEAGKYPFYTSSENQTKFLDEYQHEPGCLVFGTGGKASAHFTIRRFATSTDCITIRPKPKAKIDAGYVFQFFKGNMQVLESGFKGAGLKHISKAYLADIQIPHPEEIDDQKRIAHLLGKVEGLITRRKKHLQQLDDLLKSVFLEMFGDPVRNEMGWERRPLGKLATIERGRFSPRPRNDPKFYNGLYPFIQTGDISRSKGRLREYTQTLNEFGIKISKEFTVDTIVIAIVGATIGETAILKIPTYAPDSVIGITPKTGDKETESVFIEFLLRFWKPVIRAKAPEAARANINIETLRPLPVIWPSRDDREKFAAIVEKVESLKSNYQQSLTDLESLYSTLSQKAFKGELDLSRIDVSDMDTNSANALPHDSAEQQELEDVFDPLSDTLEIEAKMEFSEEQIDEHLAKYLEQHPDKPFVTEEFIEALLNWSWETIGPENLGTISLDFKFGVTEYGHLRKSVFQALNDGRLKQTYDDSRNRVKISPPKS